MRSHSILPCIVALGVATSCSKGSEPPPTPAPSPTTYAQRILGALDRGAIEKTRADMVSIGTALGSYSVDNNGGVPTTGDLADLGTRLTPTYIRRLQTTDAWASGFVYQSDGSNWSITAPGMDGQAGTGDDIIYANGAFTKMPDGYRDM